MKARRLQRKEKKESGYRGCNHKKEACRLLVMLIYTLSFALP
jgi:hypothetical protein